eukprot:gnl/Trimastix_PCT/1557.p1 GENE.gnl/Trimastix_PCT/1557~~gnl/Trimastix_PCT/1557.p1  ORF type:complete len:565 (+),score=105.19 gnl/Trimastix_PCT/1557:1015-2709(+)
MPCRLPLSLLLVFFLLFISLQAEERTYGAFETPEEIKLKFTRPPPNEIDMNSIPASLDLRDQFGGCASIKTVLNQGTCGCCWTFASTSATADRLCMHGQVNKVMSPQYQLDCDRTCEGSICQQGCRGGYLHLAFQFQQNKGVTPLEHRPYMTVQSDCPATWTHPVYKPTGFARLLTVDAIKEALYRRGPVAATFMAHADLKTFPGNTVYEWNGLSDPDDGYHAIKIIGYGSESGKDYWIIQNSWGSGWGSSGYFKMLRGSNHCNIESNVWEPMVEGSVGGLCYTHGTCSDCAAANCTWCESSSKCMDGTSQGPTSGTCDEWYHASCPDPCKAHDSCSACTAAGCGWCSATAQCHNGTTAGPLYATCAAGSWYTSCPADTCHAQFPTCDQCSQSSACGWCSSTARCVAGTASLASYLKCPVYSFDSCPTDPCTQAYVGCSDCVKDYKCGYCPSKRVCLTGNVFGPSNNTCAHGWSITGCAPAAGSDPCSAYTTCATCVRGLEGCGWCGSACKKGDARHGPLDGTDCGAGKWSYFKMQCPLNSIASRPGLPVSLLVFALLLTVLFA